ncbi:MAG: Dam family site-specific DNA-(adenine-N6)-methyltransferase, partial [Planctomycetota bacterium]
LGETSFAVHAGFRRNMRALLERRWLSQEQGAEEIGVDDKWMRRACHRGLKRTDSRTVAELERVANFFGIEINDLWDEKLQQRPNHDVLIKWSGGKRRQADAIVSQFPSKIDTYYEPFLGGGAVLYRLLSSSISVKRFRCSDICEPLIGIWNLVQHDPRHLVERYEEQWHRLQNEGKNFFHEIRDRFNASGDPCDFFFLLRTCRKGLVRFNRQGHFTSGFHHGRDGMRPAMVRSILKDWHEKLVTHDVDFAVRDYADVRSTKGDWLYLDPPYDLRDAEMYGGRIDLQAFYRWLRLQRGGYAISLNGFVDGVDRTLNVPPDVFHEHVQIKAEAGSTHRMSGSDAPAITDSLYIKRPSSSSAKSTKAVSGVTQIQYEPVLKLPSLCHEDFLALRDNIAINGVLVPIIVDSDGPVRRIIDGNYRKQIADEFGYDCPEIVQPDLDEDEKRTLARALNLARRQLSREQKRELVADQLCESPDRSNRWVAKQLGVHHATVDGVRAMLESNGQIETCSERLGSDDKVQPASKTIRPVLRSDEERQRRMDATTLIQGDCRDELPKLASNSVNAVITDPIYPEVDREYGRITEAEWHELMTFVVKECRRVLKPQGSAVFILQPNYEQVGKMRLWLWEFLLRAAKEWNLVQDVYSWTQDAMPLTGTSRKQRKELQDGCDGRCCR